jgi:hypothetical protein
MKYENDQVMPLARKVGLVVKRLNDEVLVYDLKRHKAHALNESAAFVWQKCNGYRTVTEISQALGKDFKGCVDEQTVWIALELLSKFNLLKETVARPVGMPRISRRNMMRTGAAAAFALPAIISIVAPTAASAASTVPNRECRMRPRTACLGTPCEVVGDRRTFCRTGRFDRFCACRRPDQP